MPEELPGTPVLLNVPAKKGRKRLPHDQKIRQISLSLDPALISRLQEIAEGERSRSVSGVANRLLWSAIKNLNIE